VAASVILTACSGSSSQGGSAQTESTASTAALKRLEVQVTPGGTAALPATLVARLGALGLGGPRAAEAATVIPNCAVTASTLPSVAATTPPKARPS
jgi:hypothetical protein